MKELRTGPSTKSRSPQARTRLRTSGAFAAVLLVALNVSTTAMAGDTSTSSSSTSSSTTTTTGPAKSVYVAPLSGMPDPRGLTKHHSAITIKIDNTYAARPQFGVNQADVVYEEIVEGGITRLAAVFDSQLPSVVGPIRSVRRTDREIVYPIRGVFACSGGAQYALQSIATAPVKFLDESTSGGAMFRDSKRYPPHNLLGNASELVKLAKASKPPKAIFKYRARSEQAPGAKVRSFTVGFAAGYATSYTWDQKTLSWNRFIFGAPDLVASGAQLSPRNVIVMNVNYKGGVGVIGAEAQLTGSGPVEIFTDGRVERGTWSRGSLSRPIVYKNNGRVIELTPGQTWVELLDTSERATITAN
ncbi:MAG: DUF3048 domain-containing protein [Acidimicrobiales bacterium]